MIPLLLILFACSASAQPDYWAYQVYFSGTPINHIPKGITIPDRDKGSRAIVNAIIGGTTYSGLKQLLPDSLDERLEKLVAGRMIERHGDTIRMLFPALAGEKRDLLRDRIRKRIMESGIRLDTLVSALEKALPHNPELVFHFLWSRIIDESWWNSYNATFQTGQGPPSIAFLVYPPHPFQCGTNSDYTPHNDMFALSWSYNIFGDTFRIPATRAFFALAQGDTIRPADRSFFAAHRLCDETSRSRIFTYRQDDPLDRLCDQLKEVYIGKINDLFDYRELGHLFGIAPDDFYILALHEVAYELIGQLQDTKPIRLPVTREGNPDLDFRPLVSIRYAQ